MFCEEVRIIRQILTGRVDTNIHFAWDVEFRFKNDVEFVKEMTRMDALLELSQVSRWQFSKLVPTSSFLICVLCWQATYTAADRMQADV
jgi:hypothetical protein